MRPTGIPRGPCQGNNPNRVRGHPDHEFRIHQQGQGGHARPHGQQSRALIVVLDGLAGIGLFGG